MKKVSVAALVELAIAKGGKRMISVPAMVSQLRQAAPGCEHTDEELRDLVAMIAISKGCNLSFIRPPDFDPPGEPSAARGR